MTQEQFFAYDSHTRDHLIIHKCYVDIANDLIAGIVLSKIIYWFTPDKEGDSKLHVVIDGEKWLAKSYKDWWDECRISVKQATHAITYLQDCGLITKTLRKFNGIPTIHIKINWVGLLERMDKYLETKGLRFGNVPQNGFYPEGISHSTQKVESILPKGKNPLTETTTKNTTKEREEVSGFFGKDSLPPTFEKQTLSRYNKIAEKCGFPKALSESPSRLRAIRACRKAFPNDSDWDAMFAKLEESKHLARSDVGGGWFCFDWIFKKPENFEKVRRGWMDWKIREQNKPSNHAPPDTTYARHLERSIRMKDL